MADGLFGGGGAAFGVYPQMGGRRRMQDPQGSADVPLQALIGRLAGLLGAPAEVGNIVRSPQPMEMFGDVNYDPQTQLPYDTKYFNQRLPLQPTSRAGELAREAGSFVPLNPMPAVRAGQGVVRMAGQEITDVMSGLPARSALGAITPQPMFAVSPINLNKGIYKPDLTMEEMLKVKDIPTVDRVRQSIDLVGEKEFEKMVNAQYSKYKPSDVDQEAMLVESVTLDILGKAQRSPYPQQAALDLAQQRAALPVEQGGLGLPKDNTPEMRAKAMGGKEMVHFSRKGGDYTTLDSGKFAVAPFDAVGTHVGTPQTALERYENTMGYKVNNPNYANDELKGVTYPVTVLGKKPLMNQNGMPFGEDDLNAFLRQQGGHNWSDVNGGKLTYQDMNKELRKKLFEDQGYTSIPYYNEVEGKGSISYIVPPENLRSRFSAFDPFRKDVATATAMGVALPDLLAQPVSPMYTDPFGNTIGESIR